MFYIVNYCYREFVCFSLPSIDRCLLLCNKKILMVVPTDSIASAVIQKLITRQNPMVKELTSSENVQACDQFIDIEYCMTITFKELEASLQPTEYELEQFDLIAAFRRKIDYASLKWQGFRNIFRYDFVCDEKLLCMTKHELENAIINHAKWALHHTIYMTKFINILQTSGSLRDL